MATNNQTNNKTGRGPIRNHYRSLTQALAVAMPKCIIWREADNGTPVSAKELFDFSQKRDVEHPLREEEFYMVSREGAIGLSPGLEWLTRWMFIPMEPCKERDFVFLKMQEELQTEAEVKKAVEEAVQRGLAAEKAAKAAEPAATDSPYRMMNFCEICGAKLPAGAKFCTNCGNKLENN